MTVILVLATLVVLLSVDHWYSKRHALAPQVAPARSRAAAPAQPGIVAGFEVKEALRYHPGHTWALAESPNLIRVGLDDFAARLIGRPAGIDLPKRGQWLRQGQKIWSVRHATAAAEMVSPIEGIVMDINERVLEDPELATRDPYGEGWLVTVQAPDARTSFRNLLNGSVARRWMEDAANRLRLRMPALAGATALDGGVAVRDTAAALPAADWNELTHEFFLS